MDNTLPSIPVATYRDWYRLAGEFFKASEDATLEELHAGHKALTLAWFGLQTDPLPHEAYQASIILDMAGRRLLAAEMQ